MILKRRPFLVQAFCQFDANQVSQFDKHQIEQLINNSKIIRNHAKIEATIHNAKQLIHLHEKGTTLSKQLWSLSNGVPINDSDLRKKDLGMQVEHELKVNDFKRVGPVTVNSFLQAAGFINDHELTCFRHSELLQVADKLRKGI